MFTKEEAFTKVSELVERFDEQLSSYKRADYNETLTRRDFIDPFFKALGWDIDNSQGYSEANREVIHEDKLKIGSATKAPDYSFRLPGGKRQFFLEAKKPSVVVKDETAPAYQVRRYGWSAKLPISLITDFEEFAVYDCTKRPFDTDKASTGRIKYLTYKNYLTDFDFIWNTFSKVSVLKGGLDKYILSDTQKKGTATVDKEFLASLDEWRKQIALNTALRNKELSEDELNFVVQQIIDRIIFLRIAEDRKVETYGQLQNLLKTGKEEGTFYKNLYTVFKEADSKYNSGLFDFKKDKISANITIDNKVIKTIINELYYPICPYEFSVLGVEILGSAYEQFLGKQIKLDKNHRAVIEEKPEVRKAGGVYYTPQYIVEYIVEQTIGKLAEGKTPEQVAQLKIVDPACGSGSFLLGAYDYLLKWHLKHYTPDFLKLSETASDKNVLTKQREAAIRQRNKLPLTPEGYLTTALKKQILLNNIYGVDLDTQAVEVTKLSLLLKCMEGETASSINAEMRFGERVLPTLDDNIKSGNSLIDLDFYDTHQTSLSFGEGRGEAKIKPFNWEQAFPQVFSPSLRGTKQSADVKTGFDVVIGNPPYIKIQALQEFQPDAVKYFKQKYKAGVTGNFDIYILFDEKGYDLLNENGMLGFIQPHKFFQAEFGQGIREIISKNNALFSIVSFGAQQVFEEATTYTCILILRKSINQQVQVAIVEDLQKWALENNTAEIFMAEQPPGKDKWNFSNESKGNLLKKISTNSKTLADITRKIFVGLQTSADKIYILKILQWKDETVVCYSNSLDREVELERGIVKPFLLGKDLRRYEEAKAKNVVIFPYKIIEGKAHLFEKDYIKNNFPSGWNYLKQNKEALENRESGKMKGENFYAYIYPKNLAEFECKKIMTPDIANHSKFTIDNKGELYHTTTIYSFVFKNEIKENPLYFLGIFNSPLLWYFLSNTGNVLRGGFFRFKTEYLKPFPIKLVNWKDIKERKLHNDISSLVELMLELKEQKQSATLSEKIEQLNQRIAYTDEKINKLVYELYGLSEEEIEIVEGKDIING